jgi:hypothetical protein
MPKNVSLTFTIAVLLLTARSIAHQLNWYRFIGRVLGKALYEGILVDVTFAGFFLAKVGSFAEIHSSSDKLSVAWETKFLR